MLFATIIDYCVFRGTFHIPVWLLLVPFISYCPVLTYISCWSSVMVYKISHKTPDDNGGDILILGQIWIFLARLLRTGSRSVAICENSIVLSSDIITVMSLDIINGDIVGVICFARCIFAPDTEIDIIFYQKYLLGHQNN